jgi:hypothetical protein
MKALRRVLPLLLLGAADGVGAQSDALAPILVPSHERLAARRQLKDDPAVAAPARPTLVSEHARELLAASAARLAAERGLAGPGASPLLGSRDVVLLDKYVVQMPRLQTWTPRRDAAPVLTAIKSGVLHRHISPDGRETLLFVALSPAGGSGPVARAIGTDAMRVTLGLSFQW